MKNKSFNLKLGDKVHYLMPEKPNQWRRGQIVEILGDKAKVRPHGLIKTIILKATHIIPKGLTDEALNTQKQIALQNIKCEKQLTAALEAIASTHLDFQTLRSQNYDGADFKEVSVWGVEAALRAAYALGLEAAKPIF